MKNFPKKKMHTYYLYVSITYRLHFTSLYQIMMVWCQIGCVWLTRVSQPTWNSDDCDDSDESRVDGVHAGDARSLRPNTLVA